MVTFILVFAYLFLPMFIDNANKWLWNKKVFWINYSFTVLLLLVFLFNRYSYNRFAEPAGFPLVTGPFIFYSLYAVMDFIVMNIYNRHFIIVNKSMSEREWGFNWVDRVFTTVIVIAAMLLPIYLFIAKHR